MASFGDLNAYLDPHLTLPISGREFTITAPSANDGLRMKARVLSDEPMSETDETTMAMSLLGGKWDNKAGKWTGPKGSVMADMMAHADWDSVYRAAKTALVYFTISREIAERYWRTGDMLPSQDDADPTTGQQPQP